MPGEALEDLECEYALILQRRELGARPGLIA
jgi:hypothetical protein